MGFWVRFFRRLLLLVDEWIKAQVSSFLRYNVQSIRLETHVFDLETERKSLVNVHVIYVP